jgi:hypothetical protein
MSETAESHAAMLVRHASEARAPAISARTPHTLRRRWANFLVLGTWFLELGPSPVPGPRRQ